MYQGHYVSKKNAPRKIRRKISGIALIALFLSVFTIGGTVAFLITESAPIQNAFTPVKTEIEIKEDFNGVKKENVKVVNNCEYPVYVRATYVANWVSDSDGSILAEVPELKGTMGSDWTLREADGYYYYNKVLEVGKTTSNFIDSLSADAKDGYHLVIDVIAESVQAEPDQAVRDVWGFIPTVSSGS